jgi:hypothetical protein
MLHRAWPYLVAALAVLPFMITGDSLWMDEGNTSIYAREPDWLGWLDFLHHDTGGDCQMVLGMFFAWLGGMTIGASEWELRAVNLFWGGLTLIIVSRIGRRLEMPWLPLFFVIQPFFWFYTNEARPYAPQITMGALLLLSFVQFIQDRGQGRLWSATFTTAIVLLCASTMLAPALIGIVVLIAGLAALKNGWKIERGSLLIIVVGALLVLPLGYYYYETLVRGAKGAQLWKVDYKYLVYIGYELSGALGLGPSVEHLRELALRGAAPSHGDHLSQLALPFTLLAVVSLVFGVALWNRQKDGNQYLLLILLPFLIELFVFFFVGIVLNKAFWPRHYSPVFPFYVTALALALKSFPVSRPRYAQVLPLLLFGLLTAAVIGIRLGPEHRKEDYRWASHTALSFTQEGKDVGWCASASTAAYYGVTFDTREPGQGGIFLLNNWDGKFPLNVSGLQVSPPDEIILSRPDVHDRTGNVRNFIRANGYHLEDTRRSFELWAR